MIRYSKKVCEVIRIFGEYSFEERMFEMIRYSKKVLRSSGFLRNIVLKKECL